ncbi:MAG: NAD-dependent epimerase/dehydratase family protein [Bacteroidetes bacterium]|nr:NAD-dependent epimerase/dehydratase family protein [Bacteroidota bacterium]
MSIPNIDTASAYAELQQNPAIWLVTGVAGFVASNLLETLLGHNQKVVGLDKFSTGCQCNPDEVLEVVAVQQWQNFTFIEGDIRKPEDCQKACAGVDYVLH